MHDDQLDIDADIARSLIDEQFPQWRAESVRQVAGHGTVNAIFRIGHHHAARFPLNPAAPDEVRTALVREAGAMNELVAASPVLTPVPVAIGEPGTDYPLPWSIQTWVPGEIADSGCRLTRRHRPRPRAPRAISPPRPTPEDGRSAGRVAAAVRDSDSWMATCLHESEGMLPVEELRDMWARARELPDAAGLAMTHGDLIPGNLLLDGERLSGVIDGGASARPIRRSTSSRGGICWMPTPAPCSATSSALTTSSGTVVRRGRSNRPWTSSGTTQHPTRR